MLKTVIAAMLKHKQVVFAVVAVAALSGLVIAPATQNVRAQDPFGIVDETLGDLGIRDNGGDDDDDDGAEIEGDDNQAIDQAIDQENDQEQEAEQDVTQTSSQDETNIQANELDTGDNTATVAQSNDATQAVEADSDADDNDVSAKAIAEAEDDDHKHKKHHSSDSDSASADADADAIITSTAEATGTIDQDNDATVKQDSSIHDVDLSNNVAFGDDTNTQVAVPIIDQDQRAANLAANLAANIDEEYGFQTGGGGGGGGDNDGVIRCFQENQGFGPVRECIRDL